MKRAWRVAAKNLRRNKRRNLATAAAIALGYAGLVVLGGYAVRVERMLRANAVYLQHSGHVAVWMEGGLARAVSEPEKFQLDPAAQEKVLAWAAGDARVELAGRYLEGVALAGNGCGTQPTSLLGVEPAALQKLVHHPEVLRWSPDFAQPVKGEWPGGPGGVANGAAVAAGLAQLLQKPRILAETVGLEPAPTILHCDSPLQEDELGRDANVQLLGMTYDGITNAVDTEMVSIFHAAETFEEDGSMVLPITTLQTLYGTDRVTYVALFLHNPSDAAAVAAEVAHALGAQGLKVEAFAYDDERWNPYYVGTMAFLGSMVSFITLLVTLVLVLTVLGAMTLTLLERTREIGTWRALGFGRRHVESLLVREAFLLACVGLGAGLVLGLLAALGINGANIQMAPPGVPGTVALLVKPAVWTCALQALLILPGVSLASWLVVRKQVHRGVVDLLTSQSG